MAESSVVSNRYPAIRRFFRLLSLDKREITYLYIFAIFAGLINLSLPLGIQSIIGFIAGGEFTSSWVVLIVIVTLGVALTGMLKVLQMRLTEMLERRIFTRSSFEFAYRIPRLRLEYILSQYPPELVNRFFDTLTLQKGLSKILLDFSSSILEMFFGILLISLYHPMYLGIGILLIVFLILIFVLTGPRGLKTSLKESSYKYEVAHWLEELARAVTTFKLAGNSPMPLQKTDSLVVKYLEARRKHFAVLLRQYGFLVLFRTLITALLLTVGSILVLRNQINIGQFVASEIVVLLVMASAEKLIVSLSTIYDVLTSIEKIGSVTDLPIDDNIGVDFNSLNSDKKGLALQLRDVSYKFEDNSAMILKGVSFEIAPGEKVCIAGSSGSGKSTLMKIILGNYTNFTGSVVFNGLPLRNIDVSSLHAAIGDISIQEDIFRGSLQENISLARPNISLQDVFRISEQLGLSSFVQRLPQGYDTQLPPGGRNLPKSVIRKIIIARSLIHNPALVALEAGMNDINPVERSRIAKILTDPKQPFTLLTISNDILIASGCDKIIVLHEGAVHEVCTYEEVQQREYFSRIFS